MNTQINTINTTPINNMALLPKKKKKTETLKERVRRHIHDKNDVITDEDIRDAIAGEVSATDNTETPLTKEEKKEAKKMEEEIPENKKTTPWDILSED